MPERLVAPHMVLLLVGVVMKLLRLTMVLLLRIRLLEFICDTRLQISLMARPAIHHHMLALLVSLTKHAVRVMRSL